MFKFVFLIRKISGIPINQQRIILITRGTMASQDTDTFASPSKRCESGQFIHSSTAIKLQWLAWSTWIQRSLKSIMIYQLAKLLMNRRLVQERYMAKKREEKMPTCTIKEITDDYNTTCGTPWCYRLIPCCVSTPRPKVVKPKTKKKALEDCFE